MFTLFFNVIESLSMQRFYMRITEDECHVLRIPTVLVFFAIRPISWRRTSPNCSQQDRLHIIDLFFQLDKYLTIFLYCNKNYIK